MRFLKYYHYRRASSLFELNSSIVDLFETIGVRAKRA